jgi:hypothetical protein
MCKRSDEYNLEQLLLRINTICPAPTTAMPMNRASSGSRFTVCSVPINSLVDLKVAWILGQCRMNK